MSAAAEVLPLHPSAKRKTKAREPRPTILYVEFAVASNFCFLRGASHPEELMGQAEHLKLAGLGLCDRNSVAGVVRAHLAKRENGWKLNYHPGVRLVFADGTADILAYPRNRAAWGRLCRLLTRGNLRAEKGECVLYLDDLLDHAEGLELVVMERCTRVTSPRFLSESRAAALAFPPPAEHFPQKERERTGAAASPPPERGRSDRKAIRVGVALSTRITVAERDPLPSTPPFRGRERGTMPPSQAISEDRTSQLYLLTRLQEAAPGRVRLAATMLYRGNDRARLAARAELARRARVPLIAVNDVLYHHPERRLLQDVLTCIREHVTIDTAGRRLAVNAERTLKPAAEMARLFRDAPEAIEETLKLDAALTFSLDELKYEYPDESIAGFATPQAALEHLTWEGAKQRYPDGITDAVRNSLANEFALIGARRYAPYFLTVYDIVRFARANGILCQGRGSAANSTVCYCLGVTSVDPVRGNLLFERFISTERDEPPDIDVDFEHERREEVIQYIYGKYGRERAGIAATVISYRGRSAIREVGKTFGLSEDMIGALASSIWGMGGGAVRLDTLRRVGLDPQSPRVEKIIALAKQIQGFPRHLSQHVGGFVITRSRLDEVMPIMNGAMDERTHVEWDKDDLDALGILKVDVLGLGMLTCLRKGFELCEKHYPGWRVSPPPERGRSAHAVRRVGVPPSTCTVPAERDPHPAPPPFRGSERESVPASHGKGSAAGFDLAAIPAEEESVYRMLQRADSIGVFQVESRAQMSMLPRLKPKEFYDLVIEVAIVRPGPIQGDMVHPYLRRRQGLEKVEYPSEALKAVLSKTLGVPLFQEQAMKIAIVAGGFTPGEADKLRRAMATFKRTGTIGTFRDKMIKGMIERNYDRAFAERCFSQIEGFGEYGFPESHAASFALLVYASAWFKCRYPDVFAAALLNAQPMGFYAPAQIVRDVREHGVEVRPVDINFSDYDATLEPGAPAAGRLHSSHLTMRHDVRATHALRLGMREVKGLSEKDARLIVEKRGVEQTLPYISVRDIWLRTGLSPRVLERLADADGFGSLGLTRRQALWAVKALGRAGDQDDLPLLTLPSPLWGGSTREARRGGGRDESHRTTHNPSPQGGGEPAAANSGASSVLPLSAGGVYSEPAIELPPMPLGEEVVNDYRFLSLSLRAHPASFLRVELAERRVIPNEELRTRRSGERVTVSGLVTIRQRPGSANGVIFMTIEDETGIANIIVWPNVFERFRPIVLGARYVAASGKMQEESGVIHIVADRLEDLTALLARLTTDLPPIEALARADAVKRPHAEDRPKPRQPGRIPALSLLASDTRELAADLDVPAHGSAHSPARRTTRK